MENQYKYPQPYFSVDDYIHQNTKASNTLAFKGGRVYDLNGFYEDYQTIQKIIGAQNPIQLKDFCGSQFDKPTAQFVEAFSILLKSSINRQEEWKLNPFKIC